MTERNCLQVARRNSRGHTRFNLRLFIKWIMYPGTNWVSRDKALLTRTLLAGSEGRRIRTLDCGCGNAYFSYEAYRRGSDCVGITIHDWERHRCEEMRDYLGIPAECMRFVVSTLSQFASDPAHHGQFDQVLLLDVIEHILDDGAALRQLHKLLADDGFLYITTPDRDWQSIVRQPRVTRYEDGWHVRNGYTFEQLEALLARNGFEPIDRMRFGTLGSTVAMEIQQTLFGRWIDELTLLLFPVLKMLACVLSPWRDPHTVFVLARKRQTSD
jgi:2-polyprenyl-3-methyl-5-hydroxy-6-metoxy-1,4-benzoquinol methylase